MATSTIPALKAKLVELLGAAESLHDVQIAWGWPGGSPARDLIIVGDVPEWSQEPAALRAGRKPREESYAIEILIRVERSGVDQRSVSERAFEIAAEIEDVVGDDWTLGGVVRDGEFAGGSLEEMASPSGDGRTSLLTLRVRCDARV